MLSTLIRRSHMYIALFLMPWMALYALSTFVMNHGELFRALYKTPRSGFEKLSEQAYPGQFSPDSTAAQRAALILQALQMEGNHTVRAQPDGKLVINRNGLVNPVRITYTPGTQNLLVEQQEYRSNEFLERFHRRRGYQTTLFVDDAYAVIVDAVIVAMVFWGLSGLWMWWEMPTTRWWGAIAAIAGIGLFGLLLFVI